MGTMVLWRNKQAMRIHYSYVGIFYSCCCIAGRIVPTSTTYISGYQHLVITFVLGFLQNSFQNVVKCVLHKGPWLPECLVTQSQGWGNLDFEGLEILYNQSDGEVSSFVSLLKYYETWWFWAHVSCISYVLHDVYFGISKHSKLDKNKKRLRSWLPTLLFDRIF